MTTETQPPPRGTLARAAYDRDQAVREAQVDADRRFARAVRAILRKRDITVRTAARPPDQGDSVGMSHTNLYRLLDLYPEEET